MTDLTEGHRLYAIGDVHGRRDLLDDMLGRIRADLRRRPHRRPRVVMLGDYVDRGPDSRGVIETLVGLAASDLPASFLLGNHDDYVRAYLRDPDWPDRADHWLNASLGGAATLASYGVGGDRLAPAEAVHQAFGATFPPAHLAFLDACRLWLRVGGYLFVHAGIRPGAPLEAQDPDDLIWIREPFLSSTRDFGFKVVHGHTIVPAVEHHPNRIAVDTGAVRSGVLSCLVLEGDDVALLEPAGPRPWPEGAGLGRVRLGETIRGGLRAIRPRR
jgi:serine/threonine protein phosphatase 1